MAMMKLLFSALLLFFTASVFGANPSYQAFKGAGGIVITTNPPNGDIIINGSSVVASGTNSSLQFSTNGVAVSTMASNLNLTAGNNTVLKGTNIDSTAHINYGIKSNLSFYADGNEMVLGSWGLQFGISNAALGELAMWFNEPDSSSEAFFRNSIIVGGIVQATNVTLTAIPGTGTNVGITSGGTLFRMNVAGGSGITSINENTAAAQFITLNTNAMEGTRTPAMSNGVNGVNFHFPWAATTMSGFLHSNDWARFSAATNAGGTPLFVVVNGDSQSSNSYTGAGNSWMQQLQAIQPWVNYRYTNFAYDFQTASNINVQFSIREGALGISTNAAPNSALYLGFLGTADLALGFSSSNMINSISNIWFKARAAGLMVAGMTIPQGIPYSTNGPAPASRTNRVEVNNWIRTYARTNRLYDVLVDLETAMTNAGPDYIDLQGDWFWDVPRTNWTSEGPQGDDNFHFTRSGAAAIAFNINSNISWSTASAKSVNGGTVRENLIVENLPGSGTVLGINSYGQLFRTTAGSGGGDVTTAQLNTASNAIVSLETTRNAAVSNSVVTLLVANDTTTSNGLFSVETTRNAAVSNGVITAMGLATSNNVQVAAGTGISVATAGSGGVQTFTVTATGGAGSTQFVTLTAGSMDITNRLLLFNGPIIAAVSNNTANVNIGSRLIPMGTNFMLGFQLHPNARRNLQLRSDDNGFGSWGVPQSGGNGNAAGVAEAAPGAINFAQTNVAGLHMMLDSTNEFLYRRSDNRLVITNKATSVAMEIGVNTIYGQGDSDLYLGVGNVAKWRMEANTGHLLPQATNTVDIGSGQYPVRTNYANQFSAKTGVDIGLGSGVRGYSTFYDNGGVDFSQLESAPDNVSNVVHRLPSGTNAGVLAATFVGISSAGVVTNQLANTLTPSVNTITATIPGSAIKGVTNGANAAAGDIGEYLESAVTNISAGATTVNIDVTSVSLTPGAWDLCGMLTVVRNGATFSTITSQVAVSPTSGTSQAGEQPGYNATYEDGMAPVGFTAFTLSVPSVRVSIATNATYYLKSILSAYSAGTPKLYGVISARRVR